jgi:O-acetyl-ADP-ribose deacetylase (regulator of RNase III)
MPFKIVRNDITKIKADAIVNTANPEPVVGGGTDAAIYAAAGEAQLLAERKKIGQIARGDIAVTPAFALPAKYIIHAVGPAWHGGDAGEFDILRACYAKPLAKAEELKCKSIAFPLIATGVYGFPKAEALSIAVNEISSFLLREETDMEVLLVVFDDKAFRLSENLFLQVESFISDKEVIEAHKKEYGLSERGMRFEAERYRRELAHVISALPRKGGNAPQSGEKAYRYPFNEDTFDKDLYMYDGKDKLSFRDHLIKLLNEKNIDNNELYNAAWMNRKAFSKIMCGDTKRPKKENILIFCIVMHLSVTEAAGLLASADMAFNPYDNRDKLIIQCLERGQYDLNKINSMLFVCNLKPIGVL